MPTRSPRRNARSKSRGGRTFYGTSGGGGGAAAYQTVVLADTPLAYYRLNETSGTTLTDSSGNSRNGTYTGTPTLAATGLIYGDTDKAVTLNGSSQYGSITYASWMDLTTLTVEALVKATSTSGAGYIVDRRGGVGIANQAWGFAHVEGVLRFFVMTGSTAATYQTTKRLVLGVTYHVAAVVSATQVIIYVNGVAELTSARSGAPNTPSVPITIGVGESPLASYYNGTIDEVAVYGSALSGARILAHATSAGVVGTRINQASNPNLETDATGYVAAANTTVTRSTTWANSGSASLKVAVTANGSNGTCASIEGDSLANTLRNGMSAGRTYTISGTVNTPVAQTGTLDGWARRITVHYYRSLVFTDTISSQGPSTGSARLSVTVSIPSDATQVFVRLVNGSGTAGDAVYFDDLMVEEVGTVGTYFDGDTGSTSSLRRGWAATTRSSASVEIPIV